MCKIPVKSPPIHPNKKDIKQAINGFIPLIIQTAVIEAPKANVPSTDKSGKSSILYVIYTPNAQLRI